MGKEPTTLLDIAKALGTSIGTVHRALHNNPGLWERAERARLRYETDAACFNQHLEGNHIIQG